MKKRIAIIMIMIIIILSSCSKNKEVLEASKDEYLIEIEKNIKDYANKIEKLDIRISELESMNVKLNEDNQRLNDLILNNSSDKDSSNSSSTGTDVYSKLEILDNDIKNLYELTNQDKFEYMDYYFEERIEYVKTFNELMKLYSYRLDGIYSEVFSYHLGEIYRDLDFQVFMDSLSQYNEKTIDDLSGFLVYDLLSREGEIKNLEIKIVENRKESYDYIYKRLNYYIEQFQ